jgi:hypothetical protein
VNGEFVGVCKEEERSEENLREKALHCTICKHIKPRVMNVSASKRMLRDLNQKGAVSRLNYNSQY